MTLVSLSRRAATLAVLALMVWSVSFFLHFFWEMAQVPFFSGMAEARHWDVVWLCTRATVGDANIAFGAYVLAALFVKDWFWIAKPWRLSTLSIYLALALQYSLNTGQLALAKGGIIVLMPDVPLLSIGALPLVQWVVIPIMLIYTVKWMFLGWQISK
ncbi:LOW QUALITY PROTEIN: hypothetical protein JCM18900_13038 [Psychrobacter sp. JCM 18900]|nr:LOW QUALITY PROTEIN: hypothetical protein JCM18900_13038 [Psychrobacter sp. JCM 18900]